MNNDTGLDDANTRLEKVDELRRRLGVGYSAALDLLDDAGGDVLQALVRYESRNRRRFESASAKGGELLQRARELVRTGNGARIRVKKDDRVIVDLPLMAGVAGVVFAPEAAALATAACLAGRCQLAIEQLDDGDADVHFEPEFGLIEPQDAAAESEQAQAH